jgi:ABC-type cobalamin/Fe3+-siderophores transport system ATPase subunit
MRELYLPKSAIGDNISNSIEIENSLVIVGPNGSGKTRLGTWIEFESSQKVNVHRISAQKSLSIPNNIRPTSLEKSLMELRIGYYHENVNQNNYFNYKQNQRWSGNPATSLLNDYGKLLTFLYSDDYEKMLEFKRKVKNSKERIEPPKSKLDITKEIWESIIPHRRLYISSSSIKTYVNEEKIKYNATEMSDGERVILYLIGECLSAPKDAIIVVDEPELHLHKSIQRELWDSIENERSDCIFIYLTHDLDFASTRTGSTKICLNNYDGNDFYWYPVKDKKEIPEDIYLEILGSRDPILFVEGEVGSYDEELYNLVYNDFTIKSVGNCKKVIEITKSFGDMYSLHNLDCYGIIDRDYRPEEHLETYREKDIYSPDVSEVENLFLIDEVLLQVARQFCEPSPENIVDDIHSWIYAEFNKFKEVYATEATSAHVNYILNGFNGKANDIEEIKNNFQELIREIDLDDYYERKIIYANKLIDEKNYEEILKVFNHKGLINQVGKFFDIKPNTYTTKVKNIIKAGNEDIVQAFKMYLPEL